MVYRKRNRSLGFTKDLMSCVTASRNVVLNIACSVTAIFIGGGNIPDWRRRDVSLHCNDLIATYSKSLPKNLLSEFPLSSHTVVDAAH